MLQLRGGGVVPLSRARCCRPCLPSELPDSQGQLDPHLNPQGVAIVSIGCHGFTGQGIQALKCAPQGSSVVTGFTEALRVSNAAHYYYPVGTVECCTPSVLLSTGDAWELERCDCSFSTDINCGEQDTNRLLQGFERWRSVTQACMSNHQQKMSGLCLQPERVHLAQASAGRPSSAMLPGCGAHTIAH